MAAARGRRGRRPARQAGAYVVLAGAEPVLYVERGGKGLQVARRPRATRASRRALEALADAVRRGRVPRLAVERVDGEPVVGSPLGGALLTRASGFRSARRASSTLSAQRAASRPHRRPYARRVPEGDTIHYAANRIRPVLEGHVPDELATPHPRFGRDRWPERLGGPGGHARSTPTASTSSCASRAA